MAAGETAASAATARFKREDHKRTKHDSNFSKWQVLIGPYDWDDYDRGKEGAARYRVHNLPSTSAPGLYELGVSVSRSGLGREIGGKLDPDDIAVVYLGQADNVRSRLQRYGRSGAHLGKSYATGQWSDCKVESPEKGVGLFEEIFARGHSIVYRWAPMRDKRAAEKTEAQLLETFDYAWNKGSNGGRRPYDIIHKLTQIASNNLKFPKISKKFLLLRPAQVGIKIEGSSAPENDHQAEKSFLNRIFKLTRFQPRLAAPETLETGENSPQMCGIITSEGTPCKHPPVPGRKRCQQHKGMRIYGLRTKPVIAEANLGFVHFDSNSSISTTTSNSIVCGMNIGDGSFCEREPVSGRKRCEEHKGMRIKKSVFRPVYSGVEEKNYTTMFEIVKCGVVLKDGLICSRTPVRGRKRCEEHKGMRVKIPASA